LVWPLLQAKSIHCFCAQLCQILQGKVSVLYDFLGREDINWRGLLGQLAGQVYRANELGPRSQCAFVVDDTSQARPGRKVEGTMRWKASWRRRSRSARRRSRCNCRPKH